jgi:hypothetical protein
VYLNVGEERIMALSYDTLCRVIDMLCGKKEALEQKMLVNIDGFSTGKSYEACMGRK